MNDLIPYTIRPLKARDIPAILNVDRMVFRDPWPESAYMQELYFNPNAHYFVLQSTKPPPARLLINRRAAREAQILGFVGMRVENQCGHVSTLAVRPEWRGRGLGELLLLRALEQAVQDRAHSVTLEVRVSNIVAQNLYAKYGFVRISQLDRYYSDGEDAYLMRAGPVNPDYYKRLQALYAILYRRLQDEVAEGEGVKRRV